MAKVYKGFLVSQSQGNLYSITNTKGGSVPKLLQGLFTTYPAAYGQIDKVLELREEEASKLSPNSIKTTKEYKQKVAEEKAEEARKEELGLDGEVSDNPLEALRAEEKAPEEKKAAPKKTKSQKTAVSEAEEA